MKKKIYALGVAALFATGVYGAESTGRLDWKLWPFANTSCGSTTMINFGPGANGDFISMNDVVEITNLKTWNAMRFSAEAATEYAGTVVEEIRALSGFFENPSQETMTVSLSWSLEDEPFFSKEYTPVGSEFDWETFEIKWNTDVIPVEMDIPFEVEAGKEFYVIFEYTEHNVTDFAYAAYWGEGQVPQPAGSSYTALEGSAIVNGEERTFTKEFMDNTKWLMGTSLAASLTLMGSNLPVDGVMLTSIEAPVSVKPRAPFDVIATIRNVGGNEVSEITAICDVNGQILERTFKVDNLGYTFSTDIIFTELTTDIDGGVVPITVSVTGVNGNDNTVESQTSLTTTTFSIAEGYEKNVLIEEHTGTWCGWCVRGIVAMEEMNKMYDDGSFIGVAIHSGDPMVPADADYILNIMRNEGAPSMYVEREYVERVTPALMNNCYQSMHAQPAVGKIDLKGTLEADGIHVETVSEFGINDGYTDYRVGYIVVEDNVGPYPQQNYYAGGGNGEMGGFENEDKIVKIIYNDVVRSYKGCDGIEGSLPMGVVKGEQYIHADILPYTNVVNKDNVWIVAMLINATNGTIVNAVKCSSEQLSAVEGIITDEDLQVEFYNLQGQKIAHPKSGTIVIRRMGSITSKIFFRE